MVLNDVAKPSQDEWGTPLEALETALDLEKTVNQSILDMHQVGSEKGDAQFCDFVESQFLSEQVDAIKELADWIKKLKQAGPGLGYHVIDQEIGGK